MRATLLTALACSASALPQGLFGLKLPLLDLDIGALLSGLGPAPASDPRFTEWHPPGPGDARSPCPALNTLANHAFINPNGTSLTVPHLITGLSAALNIAPDVSVALSTLGLLLSNPASPSFSLSDLNTHNYPIEHDASLSRQDAHFGSPVPFNAATWQTYVKFYDGKEYTDLKTAATAKFARWNNSRSTNPDFVYGPVQQVLSYGESSLLLQSMSDPFSGNAKVAFIRSLVEQERLPVGLGWRPSTVPITLASVGAMSERLQLSGGEPVVEGGRVVQDSFKSVLVTLAGGSSKLAQLSQGISAQLGL